MSQEVIEEETMQEFMHTALDNFKRKNRVFPKKILVYRDGGSSTQMPEMISTEVAGMQAGIKQSGCDAKLEIVCAQKRVNSRFYEEHVNEKMGTKNMINVPKGTIIDNHVVSSQQS